MYKNVSEIVAQKEKQWTKAVFLNVFDRYFYLRRIVLLKEHLQLYLSGTIIILGGFLQWPSTFKGTVFLWNKHSQVISFFKGIELIRNSSCSHPFEEYSKMKEQMQPRILSNLLCFCRTGIEHVHIERSLLFDDISCSHSFFLW